MPRLPSFKTSSSGACFPLAVGVLTGTLSASPLETEHLPTLSPSLLVQNDSPTPIFLDFDWLEFGERKTLPKPILKPIAEGLFNRHVQSLDLEEHRAFLHEVVLKPYERERYETKSVRRREIDLNREMAHDFKVVNDIFAKSAEQRVDIFEELRQQGSELPRPVQDLLVLDHQGKLDALERLRVHERELRDEIRDDPWRLTNYYWKLWQIEVHRLVEEGKAPKTSEEAVEALRMEHFRVQLLKGWNPSILAGNRIDLVSHARRFASAQLDRDEVQRVLHMYAEKLDREMPALYSYHTKPMRFDPVSTFARSGKAGLQELYESMFMVEARIREIHASTLPLLYDALVEPPAFHGHERRFIQLSAEGALYPFTNEGTSTLRLLLHAKNLPDLTAEQSQAIEDTRASYILGPSDRNLRNKYDQLTSVEGIKQLAREAADAAIEGNLTRPALYKAFFQLTPEKVFNDYALKQEVSDYIHYRHKVEAILTSEQRAQLPLFIEPSSLGT